MKTGIAARVGAVGALSLAGFVSLLGVVHRGHDSPVGNWTINQLASIEFTRNHEVKGVYCGGLNKTARWSSTSDGIEISQPLNFYDINDRFYSVEVLHNGKTLRLTSLRGSILVFEKGQ